MQVKNRKHIWKLAMRSLLASRKRNIITVVAIALTTLLFTSVFTIAMSINNSYQEYTFRQIGGYSHGSFKDVSDEQIEAISKHSLVKQVGVRTVIGLMDSEAFAKKPAEISFMDENCAMWSYATPQVGRVPEKSDEISMDTRTLELLGVNPELNAEIRIPFEVGTGKAGAYQLEDTFTLVGYWDYDEVMPVHYINISKSYAAQVEEQAVARGLDPFGSDLNVMMAYPICIRTQMEQVDRDLGYSWEERSGENVARIGVNWGMTSEQVLQNIDLGTIAGLVLILLVIGMTGYLIIFNIFHISVSNDIRNYGLLKTIGVTPRQLKLLIRLQAFILCVIGIPIGLLSGYIIGVLLTPFILKAVDDTMTNVASGFSSIIFFGAAIFSLLTVYISCMRPVGIASKVSPVEATRYIEQEVKKRKSRKSHKGGLIRMAIANLQRKTGRTVVVCASLVFSLLLVSGLFIFVNSFDMETYLDHTTCSDFVVSSTDYFRYKSSDEYISETVINDIEKNIEMKQSGCGYAIPYTWEAQAWMSEENWRRLTLERLPEEVLDEVFNSSARSDGQISESAQIEGLDNVLFSKLTLIDGSLDEVMLSDNQTIAVCIPSDDYGNPIDNDAYPKVGETLMITYVNEGEYIDIRNGKVANESTPPEYVRFQIKNGKDVEYKVAAHVVCPYAMSFRYGMGGYELILPKEKLEKDSGQVVVPMVYLFDTATLDAEVEAEQFLNELIAENTNLMYESKAGARKEFESFKNMFILVGGLLCLIISIIALLNYFNVTMTSILSRRREFAVLQAVGMTNRQLKKMLITEGLLYTLISGLVAIIALIVTYPILAGALSSVFWFLKPQLTMVPVFIAAVIFMILGWAVPSILYGQTMKSSVVERLRTIE